MKTLNCICPSCKAFLEIDLDSEQARCEYCDTALIIEGKTKSIYYEQELAARRKYQAELISLLRHNSQKHMQGSKSYVARSKYVAKSKTATTPLTSKQSRFFEHWLWAIAWVIVTPIPFAQCIRNFFAWWPGLPSVHSFAAWFTWCLAFTFPIPLEVILEILRRATSKKYLTIVCLALFLVLYLYALTGVSSFMQHLSKP